MRITIIITIVTIVTTTSIDDGGDGGGGGDGQAAHCAPPGTLCDRGAARAETADQGCRGRFARRRLSSCRHSGRSTPTSHRRCRTGQRRPAAATATRRRYSINTRSPPLSARPGVHGGGCGFDFRRPVSASRFALLLLSPGRRRRRGRCWRPRAASSRGCSRRSTAEN